jgi:hypothetical protein
VRVLRGRTADTPWREKRVDRAASDMNTVAKTFRRPGRSPVAMLVHSSPGRRHGEERPALGQNTTTPSPHVAKARDSWVARRLLPAADLEEIVWHIGKDITRLSTLTRSSTEHTIEVYRVANKIDVWSQWASVRLRARGLLQLGGVVHITRPRLAMVLVARSM